MSRTPIILILLLIFGIGGCGLFESHRYQGYVEGEHLYLASSRSGRLKQLFVRRGQSVHRGQKLFQLAEKPESLVVKEAQAHLDEAEKKLSDLKKPRRLPEINAIKAQLMQAKSQLKLASLQRQRQNRLYRIKATSKEHLDNANANYTVQKELVRQYQEHLKLAQLGSRRDQIKAQQAVVLALSEQFKQAQWQLKQKALYAPSEGVIFDTYYREGEYVPSQQAVLSLLPPNHIRVEFFVPEKELSHLQLNQSVHLECDGCAKDAVAVIQYISPEAEYLPPLLYSRENANTIVFRVKALIRESKRFKPGQPVTVWIA